MAVIKTYRDGVREASRRAKRERDSLCVVDVTVSANAFFDVMIELTPEDALAVIAKALQAAASRANVGAKKR